MILQIDDWIFDLDLNGQWNTLPLKRRNTALVAIAEIFMLQWMNFIPIFVRS